MATPLGGRESLLTLAWLQSFLASAPHEHHQTLEEDHVITVDPGHHWGQLCQWRFLAAPFSLDRVVTCPWKVTPALYYSSVLFTVKEWLFLLISWSGAMFWMNIANSAGHFISCDWALGISISYQILPYYKPVWWFEFYMLFPFAFLPQLHF